MIVFQTMNILDNHTKEYGKAEQSCIVRANSTKECRFQHHSRASNVPWPPCITTQVLGVSVWYMPSWIPEQAGIPTLGTQVGWDCVAFLIPSQEQGLCSLLDSSLPWGP